MQLNRIDNPDLTPARKHVFVRRLLKLRDILIDAPPEQYDHNVITESGRTCGTAACAVGHAVLHYKKFPGLRTVKSYNGDRDLDPGVVPSWMNELDNKAIDDLYIERATDYYFGPFSWSYIFDVYAYDKSPSKVTKFDAIQRIEDYITQVLGCALIPA